MARISGTARLWRKLPLPFPATPRVYLPPLPPAATPRRYPLAPRTPFWRKLRQTRAGRALSPRWPALEPLTPFNAKHGPVGGSTPYAARPAARFGKISLTPHPVRRFRLPPAFGVSYLRPLSLPPAARFWRHAHLLTPSTARQGVAGHPAAGRGAPSRSLLARPGPLRPGLIRPGRRPPAAGPLPPADGVFS